MSLLLWSWRAADDSSGPARGSMIVTAPACSVRPCPGEKIDTILSVPGIGLASIMTVPWWVLPKTLTTDVPSGLNDQRWW
jgi:hypothetical protein